MFKSKFNVLAVAALLALAVITQSSSCRNEDPVGGGGGGTTNDTLRGAITSNLTLRGNKTYYISGSVFVKNGASLTIEPGTIIKAIKGTKAVLVITKNSKIIAEGTAAQPIVFTSNQAVGARNVGDWGGIVLVGNAKVNSSYNGVANRKLLEGFDAAEVATYGADIVGGGDNDDDNSGVMKYVRIEYSGISLSSTPNSELNGLSFIAVGRGTTIDYVQVSFSGDDSFEWWGGTVNCKHLIAYCGVDDDFDTDNGFTGKVQFGLAVKNPSLSDNAGASNGFESDNEDPVPAALSTPITAPVFSNITVLGPLAITGATLPTPNYFGRAAHIRRGSRISIFNSVFVGFPTGITLDGSPTQTSFTNAEMEFRNNVISNMTVGRFITAASPTTYGAASAIMATALANDTAISLSGLGLAGNAALTTLNPTLTSGSPLLNKASFTSTRLAGLTTVAYAGAFSQGDTWFNTWTELNPQNRNY
jgi:hypothetical protein